MANGVNDFHPPDGGYGWIIIISCIIINSTLAPLMQCFGIIYESKFQQMNISAAQISFLLHFHNSVMCSLGLLSGPLLKKYNFRQISLCGCFLVCTGITITSFARTYGHLIFTVCILIGTGQGVILPSTALAINSYFKKRVTLAMSFCVTGVGLLPIAMPLLCNFLLNNYGTEGTVFILGALSLHAFPGALLLRPLRRTSQKHLPPTKSLLLEQVKKESCSEKLLHTRVYNETTTPIKEEENSSKLSRLFALLNLELFKERAYVIIIIGMGISYVAELNFTLMTPFVLSELAGFNTADVALAMSIQAAADISGRLFIPIVSHKGGWSPKLMYAVTLAGSSVGRTVLAIFCDTRNIVFICAILLGLAKGGKAVFQSLILPKYINLERLPAAMGFLMVLNGILSLAIGPLIGAVHDVSNSYVYALHTATFISLSCVVLWLVDSHILRLTSKSLPVSNTPKEEEL